MRCAVVDIGSNSIRMNIYDAFDTAPHSFKHVLTECDNSGLLNYVNHRIISDEGILKLIDVLSTFKDITGNVSCDKSFYFATASLRSIDNKTDVISTVRDRLGIEIELISGENEALLSFEGLKLSFGYKIRSGIMIDMGGGSTELLGFVDALTVRAQSLPFGCLSLYKRYVGSILPSKDELKKIKIFIDHRISEVCWLKYYGNTAYLVGGTARAAGKLRDLLFNNGLSEPVCSMTYNELKAVFDYLKKPDEEIIKQLVRIIPDRLHTLVPGILTYLRILNFAQTQNIIISPTGIREGYLIKRIIK